jgi:S-DNA-T family DNA segregation ATPase FtsK/SpoIIIE
VAKRRRKPKTSLIVQRKQRVLGLLLVVLAVLVFISVVTYNPSDKPSGLWSGEVSNAGGAVGAWTAGLLRRGFGVSALAVPVVLLAFGVNRLFARPVGPLVSRTTLALVIVLLVVLLFTLPQVTRGSPDHFGTTLGGYAAFLLAVAAVRVFGTAGAYPVLVALLLLTAMATVRWSPARLFESFSDWWSRRLIEREKQSARRRREREKRKAQRDEQRRIEDAQRQEEELRRVAEMAEREAGLIEEEGGDVSVADVEVKPRAERVVETHWVLPSLDLLDADDDDDDPINRAEAEQMGRDVEDKLAEFGVKARFVSFDAGPVITRLEIVPDRGVKLSRINSFADDIALALGVSRLRILPVPGKSTVGLEVPNPRPLTVRLRAVLEDPVYSDADSWLPIVIGRTAAGDARILDLAQLPHLLVAGATGSGKSVGISSFILSLVYRHTPDTLKFVLIDPKRLELVAFSGLPHMMTRVVTDPKEASRALKWAVSEMESRYEILAKAGVRSISEYNEGRRGGGAGRKVARAVGKFVGTDDSPDRLPYLVVIIDELADLMMTSRGDVEESIARLAQMARAVGIHLILATQRPSVDVITGVIKANFASRVAYQVAAKVDSRTILDTIGAEQLLGRGDLLLMEAGVANLVRCQGAMTAPEEISRVVAFWEDQKSVEETEEDDDSRIEPDPIVSPAVSADWIPEEVSDDDLELYVQAARLVVSQQQASVSFLQRRLKLGYPRAGMLIDLLEQAGIVGPYNNTKNRDVLWDESKLAIIDGRSVAGASEGV